MTQTDAAATAAEMPDLVIRPYAGEADLPELVRVWNAAWAADGVRGRMSLGEMRSLVGHPSEHFDASQDLLLVEADGAVVGAAHIDWVDSTDGLREYRSRCWVEPAWRRRGIGAELLRETERRRRVHAAAHQSDRPRVLTAFLADTNVGGAALLRATGHEPVRWFFDMERPIDGELPELPGLPHGIEVRPVSEADAPAIWAADHEAFLDHWGGHDASEAAFRRWVEGPEFDPSLFVVAWDGDEIAAAVLNAIYPEENEELGVQRGWLDSVFTRRAWRRRGLARALIVRSLHRLRERGMTGAVLGVDADNPSGALGLYEGIGFAVTERMSAWRKPLDGAS